MTDPNKAHRRPNTQAYLRLREQTQVLFDFAVLVAHAVPTLDEQLACVQQQTRTALPTPDHFIAGTTSVAQLQQSAGGYLPQLAAYTLLGAFSFFEAFVSDAIEEMFLFHGGVDEMCRRADARDAASLRERADFETHKRWLHTNRPDRAEKSRKHAHALTVKGYRFPSELFSGYGLRMLADKLKRLRSVDIPTLLTEGLHMPVPSAQVQRFHDIRKRRNKVAHGEAVKLTLRVVSQDNQTLRQLAYDVDRHLNSYFMISEKYV